MKSFSGIFTLFLLALVVFSSCSRPYATYQKMPVEQFAVQPSATPASEPSLAETPATDPIDRPALSAPSQDQPALVRNDGALVGKASVNRRLERVQRLLSETTKVAKNGTVATAPYKPNMVERMMLKKIDKKIRKSLAPNQTAAISNVLKLGIILVVAGLILSLLPILNVIGFILLLGGIALIVLDLLNIL